MPSANDEPQLELALPLLLGSVAARAALLLLGLIGGGVYAATDADTKPTAKIPRSLKTCRPMSSPSCRRTIALAWPRRLLP